MSTVAQVRTTGPNGEQSLYLWCPACTRFGEAGGSLHRLIVANGQPLWSFDGNLDAPTVSPSLLVQGNWKGEPTVCHSFIVNGQWQFLGDCTHALAGQTVDLPPLPDWFLSKDGALTDG